MRLLFQYVLDDPATQNNGRPGQRQHGVDVFGRRGGGAGPLVGVQCKGKDTDYGGTVTVDELEAEVKKTEEFQPALREFILVTTAPDDAVIQRHARLLEERIRAEGRDLSISVWGWGRVTQEIGRFGDVIKALHPDATPFTDKILDEQAAIRRQLEILTAQVVRIVPADEQRQAAIIPPSTTQIAQDSHRSDEPLDRHLHDQIDTYRDFIRSDRPQTALLLLEKLKAQVWAGASPNIRFRITANMGAAYHRLGQADRAADCFLEAADFDSNPVPSIANKIAGLLIKNRGPEAHDLAIRAAAAHPESPEIALQRLQARGPDESVEVLWEGFPAQVRNNPDIVIFRLLALREAGDARWRQAAIEGAAAHPDDRRLRVLKAETVLDRVLDRDPSMIGLDGADVPDQSELIEAAQALDAVWNEALNLETPVETSIAHNGALLWKLVHEPAKATALLDSGMAKGLSANESLRLRLSLYPRSDRSGAAIALADRMEDTPQARILRADLRVATAPAQALEILAGRAAFEGKEFIAAAQVATESLVKERRFEEALAEAERVEAARPLEPHAPLMKYRIKKERGDDDAAMELDGAVARAGDGTDFAVRYLVCEALEKERRFDQVVDLLHGHVSTRFDSMALRSLMAAAANDDRRTILRDLIVALPREMLAIPFYRSVRAAHYGRVGDVRAAEREVRAYLALRPRSLEMHLLLMHNLFRQAKLDALRGEAAKPASDFDGTPLDLMKLAQFKDDFGDWREAHALAYTTLLSHPNDPAASLGYVAVFLRPGHSRELEITPPAVAPNTAAAVRDAEGRQTIYVIEPDPALRPSLHHIEPSNRTAAALIGHAVNDTVAMPDGTGATIAWIKPKELHALHELTENFQNAFPETEGLEKVRFDTSTPEAFEPVAERLRERHDAIKQVEQLYDSGAIPLAFAARMVGADSVDLMVGFSADGHDIRIAIGTLEERDAALTAIDNNATKGCVLDALTLHVVRRLDLVDVVTAVCGPIALVDRTIGRLQNKIFGLRERIDQPDMSLAWRGGKVYRTETTVEQKREALAVLEADEEWIRKNAEVIPAEGKRDPTPHLRELMRRAGSGFADEIRAAEGSDRLFVSEDCLLRGIAAAEFGVATAWLQPVLMKALVAKTMTLEAYRKALVAFIDTRFTFVSLDSVTLLNAVAGLSEIRVPDDFRKLASALGGPNADLPSHAGVASRAISRFWSDESIPFTARQALVGTLIGEIIERLPRSHALAVLRAFSLFGREQLGDPNFVQYIEDWRRGHFL